MSFAKDILSGATVYRALFHQMVRRYCAELHGDVLDVAGDVHAAYRSVLPADIRIKTLNIRGTQADTIGDFNERLPFPDGSFDAVLLFNAIYIADDPLALLKELARVAKPTGAIHIVSPYISNEMRDPHDYQRFTSEGLERLVASAGVTVVALEAFGSRFTPALYLLHPFPFFAPIRYGMFLIARALDRCVPSRITRLHPAPLGYFMICRSEL
jgi:SAM-dependent methyltransferase